MLLYFLFIEAWRHAVVEQFPWFPTLILVLSVLDGIGIIGAIFLYANRELQRKIILLLQWFTLGITLVLFAVLFATGYIQDFFIYEPPLLHEAFALLIPIFVYVLLYLARRGVERDIELVRSMDRLR